MEAAKSVDCYSLVSGHEGQQADAEAAYTQSKLESPIETWVRIPKTQWPKGAKWDKIRDPVCPMVYALYGNPDAGGYWEQHCDKHLCKQGFEPIPNRRSCYFHPVLKLYLVVYVDDSRCQGLRRTLPRDGSLFVTASKWTTQRQ